ncbi:septal ring lytic transglycosylase RlpA family protein [Pontibacter saemangeumensis]
MQICSIVLLFVLSFFHSAAGYKAEGTASFYADHMQGRATASGERYDKSLLTAAHPTLPFGTRLLVRNLGNGSSVVVRVNDRKARHRHNIIDLSRAAAEAINMIRDGKATVKLEEVKNDGAEQQQAPTAVSERSASH